MGAKASNSGALKKATMAFAITLAADTDEGRAPIAPEWMQIFPAPVDGMVRARPEDR